MELRETKKDKRLGVLLGEVLSFRQSLKPKLWTLSGIGSEGRMKSVVEARNAFNKAADLLVAISFEQSGTLEINIPQTPVPSNYTEHVEKFCKNMERDRKFFQRSLPQCVVADFNERIKHLLMILKN